jgi:cytochrome c biogenesis protein ResB
VFFFSHRRIWALIEKDDLTDNYKAVLGGHTNRNHFGFEDKFKKVIKDLSEQNQTQI